MEPDTVAFVYVGSLTSVPVYICIMDHLHVCGIFVGGEEVKSIYMCSQEQVFTAHGKSMVGSNPEKQCFFHLCWKFFVSPRLSVIRNKSGSGEAMENFLCGLFVYQLLLLAFVMEYIKVVILQSPHSMSALRQAL